MGIDATELHALSAPCITYALPLPHADIQNSMLAGRNLAQTSGVARYLTKIMDLVADENGLLWLERDLPGIEGYRLKYDSQAVRQALEDEEWRSVWSSLLGMSGGDREAHWIPETMRAIQASATFNLPKPVIVPAMRRIGDSSTSFADYSGNGLISHLAEMQNPALEFRSNTAIFQKINNFVRDVIGRESAAIEIPHNRKYILVHMDNRILPLSSLGTGIEEVIMLAAFCTLAQNTIVCIEEPEIHLHPLLQRKFVSYLQENTTNQYFVATHSAAFIDTARAAIFHVKMDNGITEIRQATARQQKFEICKELGYRASDILQANAVIWVEGPSDRTYLNYWLRHCDPDIIEGLHYSIMFYGGRLLSHLSADDGEVTEFIQLRALNRHVAIVMDSDKSHKSAVVNDTKQRIQREFKAAGVAWVTKGREIENYIPHSKLQAAVATLYASAYDSAHDEGIYSHALYFNRKHEKKRRATKPGLPARTPDDGIERNVDKVKISHAVAAAGAPDLAVLDLAERLQELVNLVRAANNLPPKMIPK